MRILEFFLTLIKGYFFLGSLTILALFVIAIIFKISVNKDDDDNDDD